MRVVGQETSIKVKLLPSNNHLGQILPQLMTTLDHTTQVLAAGHLTFSTATGHQDLHTCTCSPRHLFTANQVGLVEKSLRLPDSTGLRTLSPSTLRSLGVLGLLHPSGLLAFLSPPHCPRRI